MSEDINKIKELLNSVSAISKKYEEMAKLSGENFNVFNILGLSTREVRTHSAFIAELLNTDGSHGQGSVFLKLFVEQLNIVKFNTERVTTVVEKYTGLISEDKTEGGNIDIISVDNESNGIIIENKIYAGDQENQLLRYYNYGVKNLQNFELYYLTLDGKEPTDWSVGELEKDKYKSISYKDNIKEWLEQCREKAVNQPLLRETITQYINLIKQLTGQAMNKEMDEEIIEHVINNKSLKSVFQVVSAFDTIRDDFFAKKIKPIIKNIGFNIDDFTYDGDWQSASILMTDNIKLIVAFKRRNDFLIGIRLPEPDYTSAIYEKIVEILKSKQLGKMEHWGGYGTICRPSKFLFWNNFESWEALDNGEFENIIADVVNSYKKEGYILK